MERNDDVTEVAQTRKPNKALRIVIVLLTVIILAGAGVLGARELSRMNSARGSLDLAIEKLSAAEPVVLQVDNAVRSEVASAVVPAAEDGLIAAEKAIGDLNEALAQLDVAQSGLSDSDATLAAAVREAIVARIAMLTEAKVVLAADSRAGTVVDPAHQAWALAGEAATLTVNAAAEYNKHTKAGVEGSTKLSNQATVKLKLARSLLETVTAGFPEADMAPYVSYIDGRLKLLDSSRKIDSQWLANKIEDANKLLDAYNAEEQKVVDQAKALTSTPAGTIADAYELLTKDAITRYFKARDEARSADEAVKAAAAS
ncbi:MAG: hypothetical protein CVT66_03265 [Actinobacteria bacterium HGW-Actinobacteria-6]|nr:MAG: hypothetical protein CVT66_03265 [Actinobacteria bacterium HGW-Actinobacteria-6]